MTSDLKNAAVYRVKAQELRLKVATVSDLGASESLLCIAELYEHLAKVTERMAQYRSIPAAYPDSTGDGHSHSGQPPGTLGDVLYAKSKAPVLEQDWVMLVRSIAASDQLAFHALYERSHRIVFTLIMRISGDLETAETLTIQVFHEIWRGASRYDARNGTVLGWIMKQARSRAIKHHASKRPRPAVARRAGSDADLLHAPLWLQARVGLRVDKEWEPVPLPARRWSEPEWEDVAAGIECKMLAADTERQRISMLVRLAPGASYPAHTHADVEELYLLEGELWIDDRKLFPGAYNYGAPGASDDRVWSETGCTCVLITSTKDVLR